MRTIVRLCLVVVLTGISLEVIAQTKIKNIVVFFGANEALPAYRSILKGFHEQFPEVYESPYNLLIEYLDLERFPNEDYQKQLVELYNRKFEHIPIDLIIAVAPGGYDFLLNNGLNALRESPTIAVEIIGADPGRYPDEDRVVEIRIPYEPKQTLNNAFALFPGHKKVVIIGGCSRADLYYVGAILRDTSAYSATHEFSVLSCLSFDSTLQVVSKLSEDHIIFCPSFVTDSEGSPFSTSYALRQFSSVSKAPLFTMSDNCLMDGGVGGDIISFEDAGIACAVQANEILKSGLGTGLTIVEDSYYRPQYNWKELKKWGLLESNALPPSSTFYNEEMSFFKQYRKQVVILIFVFALQTILITYLIRLIRARNKVAAQKAENERIYRQIVREERLNLMAQLTASLAHELNQPLSAILFNAQAGLRLLSSGKLEAGQTEGILTDIVEDDKRAARIISSVRNIMKPDARQKEVIDLVNVIQETLLLLHAELLADKIKIEFDPPSDAIRLQADKTQLQQVLMNIIMNAKMAIKDLGRKQRKISIKLTNDSSLVTIQITDTGPGIPEAILPTIFNAFSTTSDEGMGMGLSICKLIIANHGGKIWAENIQNGGARFSFTLNKGNGQG